MSINLTDEIEVKTKKGKLGAAKQIFLEGDTQTVEKEIQDINSRHNTLNTKHESLNRTVQGIAVTGGASTANNVTYNNDSSRLNAENAQDAIDELANKKFDKANIAQESGNAEDKVMSQKATTTTIADETKRAKAAEKENSDNIVGVKEIIEYYNIINRSKQSINSYISSSGGTTGAGNVSYIDVWDVTALTGKTIYVKCTGNRFKNCAFYTTRYDMYLSSSNVVGEVYEPTSSYVALQVPETAKSFAMSSDNDGVCTIATKVNRLDNLEANAESTNDKIENLRSDVDSNTKAIGESIIILTESDLK